jgi:YidC/Oxa1 family membrane protein insertase
LRRVWRLGIALLACGWSSGAWAETAALLGTHQQILVSLAGGLPVRWTACAHACAADGGPSATMLHPGAGGGWLRWDVPGDPAATRALASLEYRGDVDDTGAAAVLTLTSRETFRGARLIQRYVLPLAGYTLMVSLEGPAGVRLVLESGEAFVPEPLPGFASVYGTVRAVRIGAAGQAVLARDDMQDVGVVIGDGQWVGVRNRFWAFLARPDAEVTVKLRAGLPNRPALDVQPDIGTGRFDAVLYAGPVEQRRLAAVDPVLGGLLFAALWDWLRQLSFGLLYLLERWYGVVGSYGLAILLLSLSVKVLMWPLTSVAERWQHWVDQTRSALAPDLRAVKREFRGEEAHRRTLEVYRQHGVSPSFTLWSLLGFLVQIPVFIAAFDMLGENFNLDGASFLWISDLARPDRLVTLPVVLPFFGGSLNLLPVLMTALTVLAARVHHDPSLSPELRSGHRRRLYAMGMAFFLLLYSFPAGMVLYWTANNAWHLLRVVGGRAVARPR